MQTLHMNLTFVNCQDEIIFDILVIYFIGHIHLVLLLHLGLYPEMVENQSN